MDVRRISKKVMSLVKRIGLWIAVLWKNVRSLVRRVGLWLSVSIFGLIAMLLFVLGLVIQNNLLQGAGGVFAGTALTLAVTIITSKEAVTQQNAKEANIRRKDTLYIPVFNDLKSIQDWWTSAKDKKSPYPRYVRGVGNVPQEPGGYPLNYPAFTSWPLFKEGPEKSDFTEKVATLLDTVLGAGANYNQAMREAKEPTRQLLDPHLKAALFDWRNEQSFKDWDVASKQNPSTTYSFPQHYWYEYIQRCTLPPESASHESEMWVWAYNAIGWMVVGDIERASAQICYGYLNVTHMQETLDAAWFKAVLEKVWTDIEALPEIQQARQQAEVLSLAVNAAKKHIDNGLHHLQALYEGGEPLI